MGAAAVAIIIKREKDLIEHFRSVGATRPESARSADALGVEQNFVWTRLRAREVIRETPGGNYYFDEAAWNDLGRVRRRMAAIIGIGTIVLAVVLAYITYSHGAGRR